jgi:hypothetical protein
MPSSDISFTPHLAALSPKSASPLEHHIPPQPPTYTPAERSGTWQTPKPGPPLLSLHPLQQTSCLPTSPECRQNQADGLSTSTRPQCPVSTHSGRDQQLVPSPPARHQSISLCPVGRGAQGPSVERAARTKVGSRGDNSAIEKWPPQISAASSHEQFGTNPKRAAVFATQSLGTATAGAATAVDCVSRPFDAANVMATGRSSMHRQQAPKQSQKGSRWVLVRLIERFFGRRKQTVVKGGSSAEWSFPGHSSRGRQRGQRSQRTARSALESRLFGAAVGPQRSLPSLSSVAVANPPPWSAQPLRAKQEMQQGMLATSQQAVAAPAGATLSAPASCAAKKLPACPGNVGIFQQQEGEGRAPLEAAAALEPGSNKDCWIGSWQGGCGSTTQMVCIRNFEHVMAQKILQAEYAWQP